MRKTNQQKHFREEPIEIGSSNLKRLLLTKVKPYNNEVHPLQVSNPRRMKTSARIPPTRTKKVIRLEKILNLITVLWENVLGVDKMATFQMNASKTNVNYSRRNDVEECTQSEDDLAYTAADSDGDQLLCILQRILLTPKIESNPQRHKFLHKVYSSR